MASIYLAVGYANIACISGPGSYFHNSHVSLTRADFEALEAAQVGQASQLDLFNSSDDSLGYSPNI